jgi:hypothetical protein
MSKQSNLKTEARTCGDCSLCCKLLPIEDLSKPANQWCTHCRPGKGGCSIYATRPTGCRDFACVWRRGELTDDWFPLKAKIVVRKAGRDRNPHILEFNVDPGCPNRWREEPYYSDIKQLATGGLSLPEDEMYITRVVVGDTFFFIFPTRDIKRKPNIGVPEEKAFNEEFDLAMTEARGIAARARKMRGAS